MIQMTSQEFLVEASQIEVIIMRGIPGSGKSSLVARLQATYGDESAVFSADANRIIFNDGAYIYKPEETAKAHGECLRDYTEALVLGEVCPIVDNTNTSSLEIAPYAALAIAFDRPFQIVTVECDPEIAAARNQHAVPRKKVMDMHERLVYHNTRMTQWKDHMVFIKD